MQNPIIDETLLVSETSLALAPSNKFNLNSWHIFDPFISYSTEILTVTFLNLVKRKFLKIDEELIITYEFIVLPIWKTTKYFISLVDMPSDMYLIGWLEEKILEQFNYRNHYDFQTLVYNILSEIFGEKTRLTNPGKVLILKILQNQKLNLYDYNITEHLVYDSIHFVYTKNNIDKTIPKITKLSDIMDQVNNIKKLKRIVYWQLLKFTAD